MITVGNKRSNKVYGYEVVLNNGSQVIIVHSRFLTNIKRGSGSLKGVNKNAKFSKTMQVGNLEGFFECIASKE